MGFQFDEGTIECLEESFELVEGARVASGRGGRVLFSPRVVASRLLGQASESQHPENTRLFHEARPL